MGEKEMYRIMPAGERGLVVEFGNVIDIQTNNRVQQLKKCLREAQIQGVLELQPTFRSLMIYYDPLKISYEELEKRVRILGSAGTLKDHKKKRILKIPCCYGARFGPDLRDMEEYTGLDRDEIIAIHSSVDYRIYMMGFLPGFVYLGGLDPRIETPRLSTPRVKIPAGAVGIGGNQTGVYPVASPGGWRLIGGTPVEFYDAGRQEPILCRAGEYIRFVPVSLDDYYDIRRMIVKGEYTIDILEEEGEQ